MQVTRKVVIKMLSVLQTLKLVYAHSTGIHLVSLFRWGLHFSVTLIFLRVMCSYSSRKLYSFL